MDEIKKDDNTETPQNNGGGDELQNITHVSGLYKEWFLDYASYVILERAVPYVEDGLKPVQRRILHALWELEDGRYNKVANVIGHTMKYHPHGDASIGDAMVQMAQKDLLIDMQGNWGNILTGDSAAAPRYIEARLSKFGLEVVFNPKTTVWQASYDGRNKEPVALPAKFPLLLAHGVEGIAVGLACKILPHNFNELIDASIKILQGKKTNILPDFITGGTADFSDYNDGLRGGRIKVRATLNQIDKKTLSITQIPFGTTTSSVIESILTANEKGKIKVRKVEDNTSENVEIIIHLPAGVSPDKTIDALFAFTDCEVSISPNACIIENDKPKFIGVNEILKISTDRTLSLLKLELEIHKAEILEHLHFSSLEKIFIEKRIYRKIEECETWEDVLEAIDKGLKPYKKEFYREIIPDDVLRLTEIKIKRISKFDSFKADEAIKALEKDLKIVKSNLANLTEYAIDYFKNLKEKYGKGRERKTDIKSFNTIEAKRVAIANVKLYVDREEGFAGTGIRNAEFVCECSDIDDIIVFRGDGTMIVTKVADKSFVGKDVKYINVFKKNDERTIYHMIYRDGMKGTNYMKRFAVTGAIRDKEYVLTRANENSYVHYLSANPNGEVEIVTVYLRQAKGLRKLEFDVNFSDMEIKSRDGIGNIVTKNTIRKVEQKEKGASTLAGIKVWFDDTVHRLNTDEHGMYIGEFSGDDRILSVTSSGTYKLTNFDVTNHFDEDIILIEKFNAEKPLSAIYYDGESKTYFVKRFIVEQTDKKVLFISEANGSRLEIISSDQLPVVQVIYKDKNKRAQKIKLAEFIEIKGLKAKGNKLTDEKVKEINLLEAEDLPAVTKGDTQRQAGKKYDLGQKESGLSPVQEAKESSKEKKKNKGEKKGKSGQSQMKMDL